MVSAFWSEMALLMLLYLLLMERQSTVLLLVESVVDRAKCLWRLIKWVRWRVWGGGAFLIAWWVLETKE